MSCYNKNIRYVFECNMDKFSNNRIIISIVDQLSPCQQYFILRPKENFSLYKMPTP